MITLKLNQDCIRDLLIYLEENLGYKDKIIINSLKLNNYSKEELMYTADRLYEANYINVNICWNMNSTHIIVVTSISYQGHQFLDTIRDNDIWKSTKAKASKIASVSLPIIQELASSFIKLKLGLP